MFVITFCSAIVLSCYSFMDITMSMMGESKLEYYFLYNTAINIKTKRVNERNSKQGSQ